MPLPCYLILFAGWLLWMLPFFLKRIRPTSNTPPATTTTTTSPQSSTLQSPSSPASPLAPATIIDRRARYGIFLQAISYSLIFQSHFWMHPPAPWRIATSILCFLIADLFAWNSIFALGRQWRIDAGLNPDHQLVRAGAYRFVRHPIYASMLFLLLGTGFMIAPLWLLAISAVFMLLGIEIRVRIEEHLLASRFGDEFQTYRQQVFAYLPIPKFPRTKMHKSTRAQALAKLFLLALIPIFAIAADAPSPTPAPSTAQSTATPTQLKEWATETLTHIHESFYIPDRNLYAEQINDGKSPHPAWLWDASMQLSALCAAARVEPTKYLPQVHQYAIALRAYRTLNHNLPGLDVNPPPKKSDRYYDDNAWIAIALLEAYELTHDPKDLSLATDAYNFTLSGEDTTTPASPTGFAVSTATTQPTTLPIPGGIYWHEDQTKSKNACSSGPAMLAALSLHKIARDPVHLATALRLYTWTRAHLQDTDGFVFDNIAIPSGQINRRKFTYNSATLLHASALLYQITQEKPYLDEAQRIARAAEKEFIHPEDGLFANSGKLAVKLIEAYLELSTTDHDPHWRSLVTRCVTSLHTRRNQTGWYPQDRQGPLLDPKKPVRLIDQAAPARAYWLTRE